MPLLTLLTDFGPADYYVAAVKGTVLRLAPGTTLVDLSHEVAPGDVEAAAFLLAAAAPAFPIGTLHLAVVDPGVGGARRLLALETRAALFLAPDNGVLTPFLDQGAAFAVERQDLFLPGPGATFHGRDRFAPAAAALLRGERPCDLGPPVVDPVRLAADPPRRQPRELLGRVVHLDRFGNLVTDIPSDWLPAGAAEAEVDRHHARRWATHYAALPADEPGIVPGSLGTLELALRGADLARRWRVRRGARVRILLQGTYGMGGTYDDRRERPGSREGGLEGGSMTRWEYLIINVRSENYRLDPKAVKDLNDLGKDGWELVSITSVNFKTGATDNIAMVFKRPLPA